MSARGYLEGRQLQPREIAALVYEAGPKWRDPKILVEAVAVCLSESQGFTEARCENVNDETGEIRSVDHGPFQINEKALNPKLFEPKYNVQRAYMLYDRRGWQPWVAYNTGICWRDYYTGRASLGVMNFVIEHLNDRGATLPLPIWNIRELKHKLNNYEVYHDRINSPSYSSKIFEELLVAKEENWKRLDS